MDATEAALGQLIDDDRLPERPSLESLRRRTRRRSRRRALGGSFTVLAVAVAIVVWLVPTVPTRPTRGPNSVSFGFTVSAKTPDHVLQASANIIRERAWALGGSQSSVSVRGHSIIVELPRSSASSAVLSAISEPGSFYLRQVLCGAPNYSPAADSVGSSGYRVPSGCPQAYAYLPAAQRDEGSSAVNIPEPDPGFAGYPTTTPVVDAASRSNDVILDGGPGSMAPRYVLGPALADGSIIKDVRIDHLAVSGQWVVLFDFTAAGNATFDRIASSHFGEQIADDFDGRILTAPIIEARTFPESGEISGNFTRASANALAVALTYGALPAPLHPAATT